MQRFAHLSGDGKYRYTLDRIWEVDKIYINVVMLNPSTATHLVDDATIRRLVGFGQRRGYGGMHVCNLFAFRATNPKQLAMVEDPVGPMNNYYLDQIRGWVLCAWGRHPYQDRVQFVTQLLKRNGCKLVCLGKTKEGYPKHPVRLPYSEGMWEPM